MERGSRPRGAVEPDASAHALDDAFGDGKPEPGAAEPAGRTVIALLELEKNSRLCLGGDTDAGIAHRKAHLVGPDPGVDDDGDASGFGELDSVAGEIEQQLPRPCGVADHPLG